MKFKPVISNRIDPSKLGIDTENEEMKKIEAAKDEDGVVDLAQVYDLPPESDVSKEKTLQKYLEREGLEYTEKEYQKEYQLRACHQILINGGTVANIADRLNITIYEAKNLKRELAARQSKAIRNLDIQQEIAKAYMFYDHVAAKALQLSNKGGDKAMRSQIEALKVALQAQTDKQKFLALAGAYESGLREGGSSDKHVSSANEVRDMLTGILSGETYEVVPDEDDSEDSVDIL